MKVHFMGIGGSGVSAVVQLARLAGFEVSGCDLSTDTPYIGKVRNSGITVLNGHDPKHLENIDILAASPAAFFSKPLNPELAKAIKNKQAITWQNFLGQYLHKGHRVIGIAGTHGKSTTTALVSLLFEQAGLDPSVCIGATVTGWNNNCRSGKGQIFITEADEFYDNFLNYHPETIILNNIEPDHPDYFKTEDQLYESFSKFIGNLNGQKNLIFNQDSSGINKLFHRLKDKLNSVNLIGYTTKSEPLIKTRQSLSLGKLISTPTGSRFTVYAPTLGLNRANFKLTIPGEFNISNALGVIALALIFGIPLDLINETLKNFKGIGRRLELLGKPNGISVYDDYAHHPTAIKATLSAIRQLHPTARIFCIVEPHSFSRTKQLLDWYEGVFEEANEVVIAPIFKARDLSDFGVSSQSIVDTANHSKISAADFATIVTQIPKKAKSGDIVVVMGAGLSYVLARDLVKTLTNV